MEVGCQGYPGASTGGQPDPRPSPVSMTGNPCNPAWWASMQDLQAPVALAKQWKKGEGEGGRKEDIQCPDNGQQRPQLAGTEHTTTCLHRPTWECSESMCRWLLDDAETCSLLFIMIAFNCIKISRNQTWWQENLAGNNVSVGEPLNSHNKH